MSYLYRNTIVRYVDAAGRRVSKGTHGARKKKLKSKVWRGKYRSPDGVVHNIKLCVNKEAAKQMLADKVRKAERGEAGMVDPHEKHRKRPLSEHVDDYEKHLRAKGNGETHVSLTISRILAVIEGCDFEHIRDISASAVMDHLKGQRDEGMSTTTSNHYLQAIQSFSRWLVKDRRTSENALIHASKLNASTDRRRVRRHLPEDEFQRLIEATRAGETLYGLSGPDRAMLYLTAAYTGLRASELASLTPASFELATTPPAVTVEAAYSKHRRKDVLPLHPELAARLRGWLQKRAPAADEPKAVLPMSEPSDAKPERLWPGEWAAQRHGAKMLREDLQAARDKWIDEADEGSRERKVREMCHVLAYRDAASRVFDFHALRHQFISMLARGGVHPKMAQELARHSTITLTMDHYAHVGLADLNAALGRLPSLPQLNPRRSGPPARRGAPDLVAPMVAPVFDFSCGAMRRREKASGVGGQDSDAPPAHEKTPELQGFAAT